MGKERFNNLLLVLAAILIIIGIPYLLYWLGSFIEIDYFGYINNWWIVLIFIVLLISYFVLRGINFEKNMGYFFLTLFTVSFFILGIRFGSKPLVDMETYALLMDKEQEIDQLDSALVKLENDFAELDGENQGSDFKNHEIIFFEASSSDLSDFNKQRITAFISTIENCTLNIKGYSDGSGNESFNKYISKKRAQNVADFIASIDQQNNTINTIAGFGDDHQLVADGNEISRSKNRRVTIEIVGGIDAATTTQRQEIWEEMNKNRAAIKNLKIERDSLRKVVYQTDEE